MACVVACVWQEEELKDAILLVFANKQDQKGALNAAQVRSRRATCMPTCSRLCLMVASRCCSVADLGGVGAVDLEKPAMDDPGDVGHQGEGAVRGLRLVGGGLVRDGEGGCADDCRVCGCVGGSGWSQVSRAETPDRRRGAGGRGGRGVGGENRQAADRSSARGGGRMGWLECGAQRRAMCSTNQHPCQVS